MGEEFIDCVLSVDPFFLSDTFEALFRDLLRLMFASHQRGRSAELKAYGKYAHRCASEREVASLSPIKHLYRFFPIIVCVLALTFSRISVVHRIENLDLCAIVRRSIISRNRCKDPSTNYRRQYQETLKKSPKTIDHEKSKIFVSERRKMPLKTRQK